jgi:DNA polymerase-3 subunit epsilon
MITLVFDTETSGFYDPKLALDDPKQGRVIQLAAVLFNEQMEVVNSFYSLIKPDGWYDINPGAQAAHGISFEMCEQYGIPIKAALEVFNAFCAIADCRVAHNIKFDSQMLDNEMTLAWWNRVY